MAVTVSWDDEAHTRICMSLVGKWNWDEYHSATNEVANMIKSAGHTVDVISDFSQSGPLPGNALSNFGSSLKLRGDNAGITVSVSKAQFLQTLSNIFRAVYPKAGDSLYVVASLDEARAVLAKHRNLPGA